MGIDGREVDSLVIGCKPGVDRPDCPVIDGEIGSSIIRGTWLKIWGSSAVNSSLTNASSSCANFSISSSSESLEVISIHSISWGAD